MRVPKPKTYWNCWAILVGRQIWHPRRAAKGLATPLEQWSDTWRDRLTLAIRNVVWPLWTAAALLQCRLCQQKLSSMFASAKVIIVPHRIMKLVHWLLTGELLSCYIWFSKEGTGWGAARPGPSRCTKCNSPPINSQCTNHRIMVRSSSVLMCALKG